MTPRPPQGQALVTTLSAPSRRNPKVPTPQGLRPRTRYQNPFPGEGTVGSLATGSEVAARQGRVELLTYDLMRGDLLSRATLLREVWGYAGDVVSRTVDTHIAELRRKLEDDPSVPRHILTARKSGYRIER